MRHEIREFADVDVLAAAAASFVAERARRAVATTGRFHFAVSGGRTPWKMFADLVSRDVPWEQTVIYQVDERVAPADDPERSLTHLREVFATVDPLIEQMPVNDDDINAAAQRYGALLPARLDLVHLGLGPDGHTASLVPGDPVLDVTDRLVAITGLYQGCRRMTLTYQALIRADQLLWLVTGSDKREPLSLLLGGDASLPAGRVEASHSLIMTDQAAA